MNDAQTEQFHALLEQWDATRARRFNHMETLTVPLSTLLAQPSEPRDQLHEPVRSALQAVEADLTGLLDAFADFSDTLDAAQRTRLQSQLDRYRQ